MTTYRVFPREGGHYGGTHDFVEAEVVTVDGGRAYFFDGDGSLVAYYADPEMIDKVSGRGVA